MSQRSKIACFLIILCLGALAVAETVMASPKDFLKVEGQKIVDAQGHEVLFHCIGLGDWLLPEGYMWKFGKDGDRPRRIEKLISDMVGDKKAKEFWDGFHTNFIKEADVQ